MNANSTVIFPVGLLPMQPRFWGRPNVFTFHSQIIAVLELTLDMNTLKKATFNEVFIYTVYNYHRQGMVTKICNTNNTSIQKKGRLTIFGGNPDTVKFKMT